MRKEYILDEQAQEHLKHGISTLCEAFALLECVVVTQENKGNDESITALNGILTLINHSLEYLAEV